MREDSLFSEPDPSHDFDLRQLAVAAWRRRWVVAIVFLLVVLGGVVFTIRSPRIFAAKTTLMIEQVTPRILGDGVREISGTGVESFWGAQTFYQTQYSIIVSRPVLERAASKIDLVPSQIAKEVAALNSDTVLDRVAFDGLPETLRRRLRWLGFSGRESRQEMLDTLNAMDVSVTLGEWVQVQPVKDSQIAAVVVLHQVPEAAAAISNAVADAYIEFSLEQKVDTTRYAADWLTDQMAELRGKLEDSESALYEFKKSANLVSVSLESRQSMIEESLSLLNKALSEARANRIQLEARRHEIQRLVSSGDGVAIVDEVINNSLVQSLKTSYEQLRQQQAELSLRYTPEHPKNVAIKAQMEVALRTLDDEIKKVLQSFESRYQAAVNTEKRLEQELDKIKEEALEINKREMTYSRLKRERDNNAQLYELVLKRQKEASLTQFLRVSNVSKLETAVPPDRPVKPRVLLNLLVTVFVASSLGFASAVVLERFDNTLKSREQVEQRVGLPFLGVLPSIKGEPPDYALPEHERDLYILLHPRSSVAECSRTVRTNILFMSPDQPVRFLLVTSSDPQEGKSTTTISLAITMAQAGVRTIVVDTDMRRPRMHKSFGLNDDLGLSTAILGETSLTDAIQTTSVKGLDVLPCGPLPPNPAELLHTARFKELLDELGRLYDLVLLDSPPVGAAADPLVLASMVDGIVLVIRADKTSLNAARQAKRRLQDVNGHIFGVVLNDVDIEGRPYEGYYYGYYHRDVEEEPKAKAV